MVELGTPLTNQTNNHTFQETPMQKPNMFAVVVQGAVWKNYDTEAQAIAHAEQVAHTGPHYQSYQGFDADNRSAVVSKPTIVRVEELEWKGGYQGWVAVNIPHVWEAGQKIC